MKYILTILMILIGGMAYCAENATNYMLSNTEVNRIICPKPIKEVHSSEEKGLQVKVSGENLYIKFPVVMDELNGVSRKTVAIEPVGVFIDCGSIYSLLLYPTDNPPQTIILKPNMAENTTVKGKPLEDLLSELIRVMAQQKYPADIVPLERKEAKQISRGNYNITALLRKELNVYGFKIYELYLYSPVETSLLDAELLKLSWVNSPVASAVLDSAFIGWTRAFIIERG